MWVGTRTFRNRIASSLNKRIRPLGGLLALLVLTVFPGAALAQTTTALTTVHDFGGNGDGFYPSGPLILGKDGVSIIGTTQDGGTNNLGSVFSYTPPTGTATTGTYTTLYSFSLLTKGANTDGAVPEGGVILGSDGNYYGCASEGGANADGTIFKLTPSGTLTKLYDFAGTDGAAPISLAEVIPPQSNTLLFYGTTSSGIQDLSSGTDTTAGTVFKMSLPSSGTPTVTTLHMFTPLASMGASNADGSKPDAGPTLDTTGNLFGTTQSGGNGGGGNGGLGGSAGGTLWEITAAGTFTNPVFYDFPAVVGTAGTNTQGSHPLDPLTLESDGTSFIGTANLGGNGTGTVFRITETGVITVLHTFTVLNTSGSNDPNADGSGPAGGVIESQDGTIYGTAVAGGANGYGTVFSISSAGTFANLHDFAKTDGAAPRGTMVIGADGNLYGTTTAGGSYNPTLLNGTASNGGGILFAYAVDAGGPTLTAINPGSVQAGASTFTLTLTGSNFDNTSFVNWQTTPGTPITTALTPLTTTFVSSTQLTAVVPASLVASDAALAGGSQETHNVTVVTSTGTTRPLSFQVLPVGPPILTSLNPAAIIAGSGNTTLAITGDGFITGTTVTIAGTVLTPSQITTSQTEILVTIPASLLIKPGTITVTVTTAHGTSNTLSISISPLTTYAKGLHMIALPYDYPGFALSAIFGYADPKLAVWNAATGAYAITPTAPADAIRLGRGYWVRFPAVTNVQLVGTPATVGTAFSLHLNKGWNMIGDPFLTTVEGSGITVLDSSATPYTFSGAASAGLINDTTYYYDLGTNQYLSSDAGEFVPFIGYWIYAGAPCTLLLNGS